MKFEITKRMKKQADYYAKKYSYGDKWEYDELLQEIYLSFCISEKRYKSDRGLQFEGFAINNIKKHLINYFCKKSKLKINNSELKEEQSPEKSGYEIIDFSAIFKDEKVINIFELRFNKDYSYKEIALIYEVTAQRIKQIIESNLENKKLMKKIDLY